MTNLEALNTQLSRVGAKMEQAARIFSELRERKLAVLAGSTSFPLQDILAREQRVIAICTEGLAIANLALAEVKKAAVPLKPTKKFRDLWDTLDGNLNVARNFLSSLSSDQALWTQLQTASEPEKKVILKELAESDKEMIMRLRILSGTKKILTEEFISTVPLKITAAASTAFAATLFGVALYEPNVQKLAGACAAMFMGVTWFLYKSSQLMSAWNK